MIRGILVRPNDMPVVTEFEEGLEMLQKIVNGPIEIPRLFDDVDIIINEEGKLNGSLPNRFLFYRSELVDILFGNILIVDADDDGNIISLSDEKEKRYMSLFSSFYIDL